MTEIDWPSLRAAAAEARAHAYAPYSRFAVGAAALAADGRVVTGCNVENASYGLTLCAECAVVSALHVGGGGRLVAIACVGGDVGGDVGGFGAGETGSPLPPCGRCRQLLWEHGGPDLLVDGAHGPVRLGSLLPDAFGPERLP